jgi:uncharacterized protein YbbK (DUF523 family)
MSSKKIVSACLAGIHCRYDCASQERESIREMVARGEAIPVCPEQLGGLATPRPPAEIIGDKVVNNLGQDVTQQYIKGAQEALLIAQLTNATEAYLKSKSPMCGAGQVYDGSFTGTLKAGDGVFTRKLRELGIKIFSID